MRNLKTLEIKDYFDGLDDNLKVNAGLDVLPKLKNLRHLTLHGFPAVTSKSLANIWQLKQLRVLELNLAGMR